MPGLLADVHAWGHVSALVAICQGPAWRECWEYLSVPVYRHSDLGLDDDATDRAIWLRCQKDGLLLITANRNNEGPDSLEAVVREGGKESLPVLTLVNPRRIIRDRAYAEMAAIRLMEICFDITQLRGSGRLYLP